MKKLALTLIGIAVSTFTFAQGKYGATPQDSITCIESLIYKDYMDNDPKLALSLWRKAYKVCPESQVSLYINGVKLYQGLIKEAKTGAEQQAYKDTMFSIFDQRIKVFGDEAKVKGYKGQTMLVYDKKNIEGIYTTLSEAVNLGGKETDAGTLVATMFAIVNLEKAEKKTKEDVVVQYDKLVSICAANNDEKYKDAQEKIQSVAAPYLDCEELVPLAEKNFEANKGDVVWLRNTVKLLKYKKCYEAEIFAKVAEALFPLDPSAESAENMGKLFLGKKDYDKAIDFFNKALEMAETDEDKAQYTFSIAEANLYAKNYSSARTYALKAAAMKSGWGEPYIVVGDAYLYSSKSCDDGELGKWGAYWAAVDKYQKAKSVDSSVADEANKKIARASASYPSTKDLFFYGKQKGDSYTIGCWINETTTIRVND
ncbi:MAG: tetratricopeptide repeat protein [Flavobacteriales bacterium]|nr:tetratricopeptide repeat protein [Flavobacteriales bacterium]